jgi:CDP-diacylglycerol--glycerol-3-phosphate 3-phosphatidyltransferase
MTLANKITLARFFIGVIYLAILVIAQHDRVLPDVTYFNLAILFFLIFALSDYLDGLIARVLKQETSLGRVIDPLVDKVIVCCSFVLLLKFEKIAEILYAWMVAIILMRELIIGGLRTQLEGRGVVFGANILGKLKMTLQSITTLVLLLYISHLYNMFYAIYVVSVLVWITVAITVLSGIVYVLRIKHAS